MTSLIKRNTTIPTKKTPNLTTYGDNQLTVTIRAYEGKFAMTKDNHDPGKFDPNFGGAGGQVEQVARKPSRSSLPVPYPHLDPRHLRG